MELKETGSAKPVTSICNHEKQLANQLKQICNQNGQEIDPAKSIPILHKLGKIYYLKGKQGPDLMCLIQSAALYNAAIARSTKNAEEIEKDLQQLCGYVVVQSGAQNQNADLIKHAKSIKKEFKKLRDKVKQKLKSIPLITNAVAKDKLESIEKQKIASVRNLQNYITVCYTKIMANLAERCHWIMVNTPCRFAIIGMGSLARKEITPYSDFEHIIALEEEFTSKCAQNEMEEVVIPYFKWFSVLFHIIVINLQETILPSVAIPYLNDFYTEVKEDNWYFDGITTRGVSFDGLMPHACKLPIGRQKLTKQKTWKTELIKPVTKMLEYLTNEAKLKNGYHLGDILTKTCFVYGDPVIFDQFSEGVVKILDKQTNTEKIESVKCQINKDLESLATRNTLFQLYMKNEINIKKIAYRSSTLFIAAMGRLFSVPKSSCFEIIEALAEMHELTKHAKHKQMYAVALACEIRLRWYMQNGSQTDAIVTNAEDENAVEKLFSIVGESSTRSYFQIAYAIQCDISKRLNLKKIHFHTNPQLLNFSIGICRMDLNQPKIIVSKTKIQASKFVRLYDFDKCLQILENEDTDNKFNAEKDNAIPTTVISQLQQAGDILYELGCYDDALEYYQKSLQIITTDINFASRKFDFSESEINNLCKSNKEKAELLSLNLKQIGGCLMNTNKSREALKYLEKSAAIRSKASMSAATDSKLASILHLSGQCCVDLNNFKKAENYFVRALQIKQQTTTNIMTDTNLAVTLHSLGRCLLKMNQHKKALKHFERALQIKQRATTNMKTDISLAKTLHSLGRCLLNMNRHKEALTFFERALEIKQRATTNVEIDTSLAVTLHELGRCLLNMNQYNEALKYFEKTLQIEERATTNAETDVSLAVTLHSLGRCLLKLNKHNQALTHFKRALEIEERATTNAETDTNLAVSLHELGLCLMNMNQQNEAMKYFERALQIKQQATTNAETDTNLAVTLYELGRCLLDKNHHNKALNCFKKALRIYEQTTANAETDTSLAVTLHLVAQCLQNMNQHNTARKYFERAQQINEQAAKYVETNTSLAVTLHSFGRCLQNMNQHN